MWFFQEITLHPTEEIAESFLLAKIYARIHLALVNSKDEKGAIHCGVSFPEYTENPRSLGGKIRILTQDEDVLKKMDIPSVLSRFVEGGYVHISPARVVPIKRVKKCAIYSRYQPEASNERKARRYAKRHDISVEDAAKFFSAKEESVIYPYIQLKSMTTGQRFSLFIRKSILENPPAEEKTDSCFSAYGISTNVAVPEF